MAPPVSSMLVLFSLLASQVLVGPAAAELVAFSGGKYIGWQNYSWDAITILGFWTTPPDDVRAAAKAHGVRLFADSHLPDAKDWTDGDKRKAWVAQKVDQVRTDRLDGLFFDFEGNGLSSAQKGAYTALAAETTAALRPLNASIFVCVGARPTYEFRNYDYAGLANSTEFLFIMGYDAHFWDGKLSTCSRRLGTLAPFRHRTRHEVGVSRAGRAGQCHGCSNGTNSNASFLRSVRPSTPPDYTCVLKGTCSPAEASIKDVSAGVKEYVAEVPGRKLVLGLPWYGQRYTRVVLPINEGQIDYKDVLTVEDTKGRVKSKELDKT